MNRLIYNEMLLIIKEKSRCRDRIKAAEMAGVTPQLVTMVKSGLRYNEKVIDALIKIIEEREARERKRVKRVSKL